MLAPPQSRLAALVLGGGSELCFATPAVADPRTGCLVLAVDVQPPSTGAPEVAGGTSLIVCSPTPSGPLAASQHRMALHSPVFALHVVPPAPLQVPPHGQQVAPASREDREEGVVVAVCSDGSVAAAVTSRRGEEHTRFIAADEVGAGSGRRVVASAVGGPSGLVFVVSHSPQHHSSSQLLVTATACSVTAPRTLGGASSWTSAFELHLCPLMNSGVP